MNEYRNTIMKHEAANILPLTILTHRLAGERRDYSWETGRRFVQAACQLPDGGLLGLQISVGPDGQLALAAFSGAGARVTQEDYQWIFHRCATADSGGTAPLDAFFGEGRRVYALQRAFRTQEEEEGRRCGYGNVEGTEAYRSCADMLEAMAQAGAHFRFLAQSAAGGAVLISMREDMPLRLRTMVSRAFAVSSVIEPGAAENAVEPLPAECLTNGMSWLLTVLMCPAPEQDGDAKETYLDEWRDRNGFTGDDDEEDDGDIGFPDVPIEELDLSVRAFNALRRAGIDTLYKLMRTSREDLMRVRNLGRKCVEEIENKLMHIERGAPRVTGAPAPDYAEKLNELIGLENVKEQVRRITAFARMKRDMERQGRDAVPVVLNMEFTGNPGTAKTTVARIVAGLFHEIGLLTRDEVIEAGRADLVSKFVGNTAPQVRELFQKAKGGLLFIDEAYSLVDDRDGSFGDEAISAIVQEMENHRQDTVVVFAGYPDRMEELFAKNPGLRSRVPFHIDFPDYSAGELVRIAQLEAERRGFAIGPEALEKVGALCASAAQDSEAGNGRFCRNLVENAILSYASRVYGIGVENPNADFALAGEDFLCPGPAQPAAPARKIGFAVA